MYLNWQEDPRDYYVIDIEADSLTPTVIHVLCWENAETREKGECIGHDSIKDFMDSTHGSVYIGHNIIGFDHPVLDRLVGTVLNLNDMVDTLVLSELYNPSIPGGHSLAEWGQRLGYPKIEFNDFSSLTPEMIEYCHQDVTITTILFRRMMKTMAGIDFSEKSIWIQHRLKAIMDRQQRTGFFFNHEEAEDLYHELRNLENSLGEEIQIVFPPTLEALATYKKAHKKDGTESANFLKHLDLYEKVDLHPDDSYTVHGRVPFNIGSPLQRTEKLTQLGWVPEEFTKTGLPKPFDKGSLSPSLERFLEDNPVPEVELIAKWMAINGRANMINTWLENFNDETECIHGNLRPAGTLRFRHSSPNTANIPAVRSNKDGVLYGLEGYYTYEARDLWCARPDRTLVGTDAAGLELRMLAHYLNRADFTDQVVNGDPHQYNADLVGVTRPQAKTLIYAIMYGASGGKIANTLGVSSREGSKVRNMFLEKLGLKGLIEQCQHEQKNGRISLVDGSQVICPSPHAALNYKLQGGGARVMGLGAILLETRIKKLGLDSLKVGDIHDEWQYDCSKGDAEEHATLAVQCIRDSGLKLNMNVPLDGESKIGETWARTH